MATSLEYIEFVCDRLVGSGDIRYRKMFGEYMVYINDKPILLVCDNTVYVKKLADIDDLMKGSASGAPYEGASAHYILDIENEPLCKSVVSVLERITPVPIPKKRKSR